ncbi:MAG: DUF4252 domain-containing protein [Cyclobacteriaceae bacterium]|nr:DUF4252 domain-containing protein [Cyclobacteriaceae bacterium]
MKKATLLSLIVLAGALTLSAQSKSFQALRDHFADRENVHAFSLSGFLCRTALRIALSDDPSLRAMARDINHVRFIVIPKDEFAKQKLSVNGFKGYLAKDKFEVMATVRDKGEVVSFFHRLDDNKKDRYFVLVEESREVVAIELKGYIDPSIFKNGNNRLITLDR